ncbi:hypothetical protein ACP26L_36020 (plasmid) [Paenibacillus sp. S-38]|uniref:hypothetical protein n=1 Tax=Paenibacillus sp. S-38 TaxID=3416710 RepID=UPI003CFA15A4
MILPGILVYILPSASLRFGGRWGFVNKIVETQQLPIGVQFDHNGIIYYFDQNELVTEAFYNNHKEDQTTCYSCGADTTGQFITTCQTCLSRIYEEDTF